MKKLRDFLARKPISIRSDSSHQTPPIAFSSDVDPLFALPHEAWTGSPAPMASSTVPYQAPTFGNGYVIGDDREVVVKASEYERVARENDELRAHLADLVHQQYARVATKPPTTNKIRRGIRLAGDIDLA